MACEFCSSLYTWTPLNDGTGNCFRFETAIATQIQTIIPLDSRQDIEYSESGTTLFSTYDSYGYEIGPTTTLNNSLWKPSLGFDGPMNRCNVWTTLRSPDGNTYLPLNTWVGFSICLSGNLSSSKTYYIGIGADDNYKFDLDGVQIVSTYNRPNNVLSEPYGIWHVYPITVGTGNHTLEIYGLNTKNRAGIGCEIYNNTFSELTAATVITDLNIIYTTSGKTFAPLYKNLGGDYISSGITCPKGYFYSDCDGFCQRQVVCVNLDTSPTPTPTQTQTPTLTQTPTPSSIRTSRYLRGCCDNRLYQITEQNIQLNVGEVISVYPDNFCYTVVPTPSINQTYGNISLRLGYIIQETCLSLECQPCPSSTPTPTPTLTPFSTPLPPPIPPIPPQEPIVGQTTNECDITTLLELGIQCNVINPTSINPNSGILSVYVTGGTAPYTIIWQTPDGSIFTGQTIYNQSGGDYIVTVYDKWRDFSATTICSIIQPIDCSFEAEISEFTCQRPTNVVEEIIRFIITSGGVSTVFTGSYSSACSAGQQYITQNPPCSLTGNYCEFTAPLSVGSQVYVGTNQTNCDKVNNGFYLGGIYPNYVVYHITGGTLQSIQSCAAPSQTPTRTPTPTPTPTIPICQRPNGLLEKSMGTRLIWVDGSQPPFGFTASFANACSGVTTWTNQLPIGSIVLESFGCNYTPSFIVGATIYNGSSPFQTDCQLLATGYYITNVITKEITYVVNGIIQQILYC